MTSRFEDKVAPCTLLLSDCNDASNGEVFTAGIVTAALSAIACAMLETLLWTSENLSVSPAFKPFMMALPAGMSSFASYLIGPLCLRIQEAIPPTKSVIFPQAALRPLKKLSMIARPASARLKLRSALNAPLMPLTIPLTMPVKPDHTALAPLKILVAAPITIDCMLLQADEKNDVMLFHNPEKNPGSAFQIPSAVLTVPLHSPDKNETTLFHTPSVVDTIPLHNPLKNDESALQIAEAADTAPFQSPSKVETKVFQTVIA